MRSAKVLEFGARAKAATPYGKEDKVDPDAVHVSRLLREGPWSNRWKAVAVASGLSYDTVRRIALEHHTKHPRNETIAKIIPVLGLERPWCIRVRGRLQEIDITTYRHPERMRA